MEMTKLGDLKVLSVKIFFRTAFFEALNENNSNLIRTSLEIKEQDVYILFC